MVGDGCPLDLNKLDVVVAHGYCRLRMMEDGVGITLLHGTEFASLLPVGGFLLDCLGEGVKAESARL